VADYQASLKTRGVVCADGWKRLPENPKTIQDWLFVQHADGQWVSAAKLHPRTISIIEWSLKR